MAFPHRYQLLKNAAALISKNDFQSLTSAALALRMFMETVIYDKANSYKEMLPEELFEDWQPAKLLKSLQRYDQNADQDFKLSIAEESSPGVTVGEFKLVGEHKSFGARWLAKHYHKLGRVLHYPRTDTEWFLNKQEFGRYLEEVLQECERISEGNILGASLSERISFNCFKCEKPIVIPSSFADEQRPFPCRHKACSASYLATRAEDQSVNIQRLRQTIQCRNEACQEVFLIDKDDVMQGAEFRCPKCDTRHVFSLGYVREKL